MKQVAWIIFGCFSLMASSQAASFDCAKAQNKVEYLICNNPEISKLDDDINAAYNKAIQEGTRIDAIRQSQRQWIKNRNACSDSACVKLSYERRLSKLDSYPNSGGISANEHKSLSCPQCGSWNIDQADVLGGKNKRLNRWDEPVGEVLITNDKTISIPDCGSFTYKITSSKIWEENGYKYQDLCTVLTKLSNSKYSSLCEGDKWLLNIEINDGMFDKEGGWGGGQFVLDNTTGTRLRLSGWSPERRDPAMYGTPGGGEFVTFKVAQSTKALLAISYQFYKLHGNGVSKPFNLARFRKAAENFCTDLIEGNGPHNPSEAVLEVGCEIQILDNKYQEFNTWTCEKQLSNESKNATCEFPDETIDYCEHDSQSDSDYAKMQSTFCN